MISTKENKSTRITIWATAKQKELIARAALRINKTISEFVLESSLDAVQALELDKADFVLSPEDYKAFIEMLDEPPTTNPALQKLLSERSLIDVPHN